MKTFRYQKCGCKPVPGQIVKTRCPEHGTPIDLKPVGKASVSDRDNKLQIGYAQHLEMRKRAGEIKSYKLNSHRFRVGVQDPQGELREGTWFKPDFQVVMADGSIQIHETKGFFREAAKVRLKACAELYPEYKWIAVFQDGGGYRIEEF